LFATVPEGVMRVKEIAERPPDRSKPNNVTTCPQQRNPEEVKGSEGDERALSWGMHPSNVTNYPADFQKRRKGSVTNYPHQKNQPLAISLKVKTICVV
ncbi:hypothetical protein QMT16_20590, partial [Cronobacter sakazakii]